MVEKVKELKIEAKVKHLSYNDEEAQLFAKSHGREAGTAKDVARLLHLDMDKVKLAGLLEANVDGNQNEFTRYNDCNWSPQLDEFLKPFESQAEAAGILMTPVLIINGKLMHQGSMPDMWKIDTWLREL
jgi:hypothetical protein